MTRPSPPHIPFKKIIWVIAFGVLIGGCATVPPPPGPGEISLKELCDRYDVQLDWDSVSQVITLSAAEFKARALVGSDVVVINSQHISLSAKVRRVSNVIIVPADFEEKILKGYKRPSRFVVKKFKKIVVDAGHGGKDPGARGRSGVKEKYVVLDIAKRLKNILQNKGFHVFMTRDTDEFISLEKRTEIASGLQADLFVSVHANANPTRNIDGCEVYYLGELTTKEKKEEQRLKNSGILFSGLSMKRNSEDLEKTLSDMLYVHKQEESRALAARLVRDTAKFVGANDRGEREAKFFVLRNTLIPAVLVEVGYLSNAREEKLLQTSDYRQSLADGIAESIVGYVQ